MAFHKSVFQESKDRILKENFILMKGIKLFTMVTMSRTIIKTKNANLSIIIGRRKTAIFFKIKILVIFQILNIGHANKYVKCTKEMKNHFMTFRRP